MQLRHILEYEDHEIQDLMGDLDSVGQMNPYQGTLWARFNTFRLSDGSWSYSPVALCFLETGPIFATGNETKDKALMLKTIQSGDFSRPNNPDARSWSALRAGNEIVIDLLEKRRVQSLAKSCSTMGELIENLREDLVASQKSALQGQLHKTRYYLNEDAASSVLVYGFLAPEGSPYLVTADLDKPIIKGEGINYYTK
jgi:hypothetical protein